MSDGAKLITGILVILVFMVWLAGGGQLALFVGGCALASMVIYGGADD